jgi:TonB family protein
MNENLLYLAKVSAGLTLIVVPYYLFLRNDPNLILKRIYLLTGIFAAWLFPFINFSKPDLLVGLTPTVFIDPVETPQPVLDVIQTSGESGFTFQWLNVLLAVYIAGTVFILIKNLHIIIKWNLVWHKTNIGKGVALTDGDQVFTLFTRIFVPRDLQENPDLDQVLLHEQAHVRQLHFIDLAIMELTLLFTWFNPFSWLISRMIKENHEHLADRQVLSEGVNPARYRAQLLNHTLGVNVLRLGNQFNHSLTLKRFKMMKKPTKSLRGIVKITLMIPAVLLMLGLTTGMQPQEEVISGKVIFAASKEPAPGAALVIAGTTMGTVTDINGDFMLKVEGDPEIVVSFVGYQTLKIKSSKIKNKPLQLERKTYTMNLDEVQGEGAMMKDENMSFEGERIVVDNDKTTITGSISFKTDGGAEANPVFVLDGKVVTKIDDLDPGSIESIEVIKDPDSEIAKKYDAKDGVILITTKSDIENKEGLQVEDETFYVVEEMPSFPGGKVALKDYIYSNLEYPEEAKNKGIKGEVQVQFTVKASGKLEDIKVIRSAYPDLNKPALKVFKEMPDWKPGRQRGKPVSVNVVVPVRFSPDPE